MFKFRVLGIAIGGLIGVVALMAIFAITTGGESSNDQRVLHLVGQDITEENYKLHLKAGFLKELTQWESICSQLTKMSDEEAVKVVQSISGGPNFNPDGGPLVLFQNAELRPNQLAAEESKVRAVQLMKETCKDMF